MLHKDPGPDMLTDGIRADPERESVQNTEQQNDAGARLIQVVTEPDEEGPAQKKTDCRGQAQGLVGGSAEPVQAVDAQKPADQIIDDTGPVVEHGFRQAQLKLAEQPQDRNGGKAGVPVAQNGLNNRGTHREDHQGEDEPERTVVAP